VVSRKCKGQKPEESPKSRKGRKRAGRSSMLRGIEKQSRQAKPVGGNSKSMGEEDRGVIRSQMKEGELHSKAMEKKSQAGS